MSIKVLYIEDEESLGKIVSETLQHQGFELVWETDGARVMQHLEHFTPDICVVDIMLPHIDGYTLCTQIREKHAHMPIIFLTAKIETKDLVKGFDAGGTDYIRKPFSMEELIIRIHNQLNLHTGNDASNKLNNTELKLGRYVFCPHRYELITPTKTIKLSQRDNEILTFFARSVNTIVDRKELLLSVWNDDSFFNSRNLDVYIRKLRTYFKEDSKIQIQTLKGKGYLFLVE